MPKVNGDIGSPFEKAELLNKRLKLFLWGDTGVGKTWLALQFPRPVVIDMEGSSDLYGDTFKYDVKRTTSPDEVMAAVQWLHTNKHEYCTLVIDPITIYWEALQQKWSDIFLLRKEGTKAHKHEFYDTQPKDWMTIKSEFKELLRKLVSLDMNVILTARQKTQYADGDFMRAIGDTFDGEKSLPYVFDTIVRMYRSKDDKYLCNCLKDRSNKLPVSELEWTYESLEGYLGKDLLDREAKPTAWVTDDQLKKLDKCIKFLDLKEATVINRLRAYNAKTMSDLTESNAQLIIDKLEEAVAKKEKKNNA